MQSCRHSWINFVLKYFVIQFSKKFEPPEKSNIKQCKNYERSGLKKTMCKYFMHIVHTFSGSILGHFGFVEVC